MKRQIIAMGGGGFSGSESLALDRYILEQTSQVRPKVCFVPTPAATPRVMCFVFIRTWPP